MVQRNQTIDIITKGSQILHPDNAHPIRITTAIFYTKTYFYYLTCVCVRPWTGN